MSAYEKQRVRTAVGVNMEAEVRRLQEEVKALRDANGNLEASLALQGQKRLDRQASMYEKHVEKLEKEAEALREEIATTRAMFFKKERRLENDVDAAVASVTKSREAWKEKAKKRRTDSSYYENEAKKLKTSAKAMEK